MSQPETRYTASVHKHLPPKRQLHWEKNHNQYRGGTADVWYSGFLDDLWAEYKYDANFPVRDRFFVPDCSPLQFDWLRGRYKEGRNVRVIQGFAIGGVVFTIPELDTGLDIAQMEARLLSRKEMAAWITTFCNG